MRLWYHCSPDRDGLVSLSNPFNADADGFAGFHVAGGAYQIRASSTGFERIWRYVAIGTAAETDFVPADVVGPASSTAGNFPDFDDATGKLLGDSGVGPSDFASSGHIHSNATSGVAGFMSATDKVELDDLAASKDNIKTASIVFIIDGGGSVISTGVAGDIRVDFGGTIQQITLLADQSGSIVVDIFKDTFANFPPVVGDSITASAKPTITSNDASEDSTLTGWTTSFSAGDIFRFNVDSVTTITQCTAILEVLKS